MRALEMRVPAFRRLNRRPAGLPVSTTKMTTIFKMMMRKQIGVSTRKQIDDIVEIGDDFQNEGFGVSTTKH